MNTIKKISLTLFVLSNIAVCCQEVWLPDDILKPLIIFVLTKRQHEARNLFCVSKQTARIMAIPDVIKTVITNRMSDITSHYQIACEIHCPSITKPYIDANEALLRIIDLTLYQEALKNDPYADINYRDESKMSKLAMICADFPKHKRNWITWLLQHGACDRSDWDPYKKRALGQIVEICKHRYNKRVAEYCDIARELLENGANPNPYIYDVIDMRHADLVQLFIKHGTTIAKEKHDHNYVWFHNYLAKGDIDENALKFLLDQGYDPHKRGYQWGSEYGNGRTVCIGYDNAIVTVEKLRPSAKRERILHLMRQYPKKQ